MLGRIPFAPISHRRILRSVKRAPSLLTMQRRHYRMSNQLFKNTNAKAPPNITPTPTNSLPEEHEFPEVPSYVKPPGWFERTVLRLFPAKPNMPSSDSTSAVKFALLGNIFNTMVKYGAFWWTGSGTMLSEALHSTADVGNQSLLLVGINEHPYGFEGERFVYALFSAFGIFFFGACFSFLHGVTHLFAPADLDDLWIGLCILAVSFCIESTTFLRGCASVFRSSRELQMSFTEYVKKGPDPMGVAVIMEDGAALVGITIAFSCIGATYFTANPVFDAVGSILIGTLLGGIAVFLIRKNVKSLIGHSTPPNRRQKIVKHVLSDPMVHSIHHVKSLQLGATAISFNADVEFEGKAVAQKYLNKHPELVDSILNSNGNKQAVEEYMVEYGSFVVSGMGDEVDRIEHGLQKRFPDIKHVGLESN